MPTSFGQRLRQLRQGRSLSLRQAASELRISHPYLVQLEQGVETPSEELIRRISSFFGAEPNELLFSARRMGQIITSVAAAFPDQTAHTLNELRRDVFISHRSTDKEW